MKRVLMEVKSLKAYYKLKNKTLKAVDSVDLKLFEGEVLGIAGESGCGKSTLAISLSGLFLPPLRYYGGEILLGETNITKMNRDVLRKQILGKRISFIPQSAMNALNPTLKIKNFIIDLLKEHEPQLTEKEIVERAEERFESLSLPKRVINAYPFELSGGMKQRTITVISTLMNPEILIADEPTSALDVSSQRQVIKLMKLLLEKGIIKSIIFITHELPLLKHVADRIVIMYAGQIMENGEAGDIIFRPLHPYTDMLMSSIITPEVGTRDKELPIVLGGPPSLYEELKGCRFAERCPYAKDECKDKDIEMKEIKGRIVRCLYPLLKNIDKEGRKSATE